LVPGDKALAAAVELQFSTSFESSDDQDAMNSADGGVRAQVIRYVEVDFEGLARCNRFPNGRTILALGSRRCSVFYWRVLTRS
jgi:hypothetical protein